MDKQIVVYPHERILDSNKKKRTIDTLNLFEWISK